MIVLCLLAALFAPSSPAAAQYFGRNKVHFKNLDFQILRTEHFDIHYYPEEREGAETAARLAERWHARLERLLSHELRGRQPLVLYASHVDFEQTNIVAGELGEGTGGVTEPLKRRIVLPLGGPVKDTDHVIGHELVHAFQFDMTAEAEMAPGETGAGRLPLWFIEGMAEYLSLGPVDANTAMWLRDAAARDALPPVRDLDNPKYFPYRWGHAFWAYVGGRWGDQTVAQMLLAAARSGDPLAAMTQVLGLDEKSFSTDWHLAIHAAYDSAALPMTAADQTGRAVIKGKSDGGQLNVAPALSPDGRYLAFLSERALLSIDLFVADVGSGRVLHELTSTASDPHYSSLQFVQSAGAWDAESRRFAAATVIGGRPALAIFDAPSGRRERDITIREVDEVFNPTWSPDGRRICFTGMSRGFTDLFMIELESGTLHRLTDDIYADLQPAWSPDGRHLAFATDRFSSNLALLATGDYRIALLDTQTGNITQAPAFTSGKNMNPQWHPSGNAIYFIADADGISNLYLMALPSGDVTQVTNVRTGISGITSSSPALSVASSQGLVAMTVYQGGQYDIRVMPPEAGERPRSEVRNLGELPPVPRRSSQVAGLLADPQFGLGAPRAYESARYRGGLQLEAIGQPTVAFSMSSFGPAVGGGLSMYFRDLLGNRSLVTGIELNSGINGSFSLKNSAAQALYLDQSRRWTWGIAAGQVPYLSGGFQQAIGSVDGEPVAVDQSAVYRQTERSVAGIAAFPFSRAQRVEFQLGARQVSFDELVRTRVYSLLTGALLIDQSDERSVGEPLNLGTAAAAFVSDTSAFGATSPVAGERYRFEVSPAFGAIRYTGVLADYRRYVMPLSFYTVAARVMHYGRYGSGAEDARLYPLSIGYPTLVRGYDVYSIGYDECVADASGPCPVFDRLFGSRVLVGNLEFRFPLLRPFTGTSRNMYGPLPVELAFFLDGGAAWNGGQSPTWLGGSRAGVSSTGATLRLNLFGMAVGQMDVVRPLQRPRAGWLFQFSLSPGF